MSKFFSIILISLHFCLSQSLLASGDETPKKSCKKNHTPQTHSPASPSPSSETPLITESDADLEDNLWLNSASDRPRNRARTHLEASESREYSPRIQALMEQDVSDYHPPQCVYHGPTSLTPLFNLIDINDGHAFTGSPHLIRTQYSELYQRLLQRNIRLENLSPAALMMMIYGQILHNRQGGCGGFLE